MYLRAKSPLTWFLPVLFFGQIYLLLCLLILIEDSCSHNEIFCKLYRIRELNLQSNSLTNRHCLFPFLMSSFIFQFISFISVLKTGSANWRSWQLSGDSASGSCSCQDLIKQFGQCEIAVLSFVFPSMIEKYKILKMRLTSN